MKNNFKPGFTLIELMAVIVILGILASVVAINVNPFLQRANYEKIRADMTQLEKALEVYRLNELTYPTTEQGLTALVGPPENLKRPFLYPVDGYIKSIPLDPGAVNICTSILEPNLIMISLPMVATVLKGVQVKMQILGIGKTKPAFHLS